MNRARNAVPVLIVLLVPLPIYLARLDATAGMMVDDAWYIMLAKALAGGERYRLVNSPFTDILPMYPPGFPALLSLGFYLHPTFPENVWLLKGLSIGAMLGVGLLSYAYLHRDRQLPRHLAVCTAVAITTTPALVFLATSTVMSECVFTLAQLGAVVAAHRAAQPSTERPWRLVVVAALLAAAAMLIRSAGVAVIAAIGISFLKDRRWKPVFLFGGLVVLSLGPWLMYARAHHPTHHQQESHRGSIVYGYTDQFWMRRAGVATSGHITIADLPARVATNLFDVFGRGVGGILAPSLLRGPDESGEEVLSLGGRVGWQLIGLGSVPANMAISLLLAAVVALGYVRAIRQRLTVAEVLVPISLAITVLWPWWTFRFLLPLTPFLFLYFVEGLRPLAPIPVARVVLLCVIGLNLYDHAGYVLYAKSDSPTRIDWLARSAEVESTIQWMNVHLDTEAVVATSNPALVYLRTGRKTITLDSLSERWSIWRNRGVRYVACLEPRDLPGESRGPHKVLFESSNEPSMRVWVIELY